VHCPNRQGPHPNKFEGVPRKSSKLAAVRLATNLMTGFKPKPNSTPASDCEGILPGDLTSK